MVQALPQLLSQNVIGFVPGAVAGTDITHLHFLQPPGKLPHLRFASGIEMKAAHHGAHRFFRERGPHFLNDGIGAAVGTAVENGQPLLRFQHQTLFMGEVIREPPQPPADVQLLPLADCLQSGRLMGNQPDPFAQLVIVRNKGNPIPVLLQHSFGKSFILVKETPLAVAVLPRLRLQIELCLFIDGKKSRHSIGMVRMGVGQHGQVHL